jgi:hypothetical protein
MVRAIDAAGSAANAQVLEGCRGPDDITGCEVQRLQPATNIIFQTFRFRKYSLGRRRIRRKVADIEHRPQQFGFRQDRLRLRSHVRAGAALPLSMWRSDQLKSTMHGVPTVATARRIPHGCARHVSELPLSRRDRRHPNGQ